jgi:hypothetical protein
MFLYIKLMDNYNTIITNIHNIIKDKSKKEIKINQLKINDYVYIEFYPDSQKYIYDLTPKLGIITNIINDSPYPNIKIINFLDQEEELLHDGCSYFGQSLGYEFNIYLIN